MDEKTKKWLEQRVNIVSREIERTGLMNSDKLADNFKFDKRRINHPDECPYYHTEMFCHNGKNLDVYCLLCSCPSYNTNSIEGGCNIENPFEIGYYYDRSIYGLPDIWDCSDCLYPHTREITFKSLGIIKKQVLDGVKLKNVLWKLFSGKFSKEKACAED